MSEPLIIIACQLGIGGIGGFFVGYAVKKITRIAIIIGVVVFLFAYLASTNVIDINFYELHNFSGIAGLVVELLKPFLSAFPFLGSFIVGLWFGFKKG